MTLHYLCRWKSITPCSILHQLLKNKSSPPENSQPRSQDSATGLCSNSRQAGLCVHIRYFDIYFSITSHLLLDLPDGFFFPLRPSDWTVVSIPLLRHARCRKVKGNKITVGVRCGLFVSHTEQSVLRHARLCCFMRVLGESWSCPALLLSAWRSCFLKQFCSVARCSGFWHWRNKNRRTIILYFAAHKRGKRVTR